VKLRTLLFWTHLSFGVLAGAVILIMSVTGVLLTYEKQLIEWSDRGFRSAPPAELSTRLSADRLIARLKEQRPDAQPTTLTLRADPAAPAAVAIESGTLYLNPYTGEALGEPRTDIRSAMTTLKAWHRYIGMADAQRPIGKFITGWANFIFFFIVLSGLYLWLPRIWTRQTLRTITFFRRGLSAKARDFNWHNTIGLWSAIPLALVVLGAMPISFPWANALVYRAVGEEVPPPNGGGGGGRGAAGRGAGEAGRGPSNAGRGSSNAASAANQGRSALPPVDALWARAAEQVPEWRSIALRLPASTKSPAVFTIDSGNGGQPQRRATLTLNTATAEVVRWEPFTSQSLGRRLRSWLRFTHTGEYYGLIGQTIAGIASAGGVMLVWTGLSLALRRLAAWVIRPRASAIGKSPRTSQAA
jgi:uncharacterized iron-regulated membrane protein